ncbi:hypothetical protein [Luteimicrobium subarcticum]|uniref:Secreted protein n=1 Tax=Luteimicrobium subarcticum TaxID=620910 RepID=A0A2M8W406_9MICO|nr:hypothetical protein [Luteimicrobium subarcticum]PJI85657.1 hypothetical protein CLV34_2841 [Luteimicrobium subarcticum]
MTWYATAALVGLVVVLAVWFAWAGATRIDRLHRKVIASRLALDTQLVRRASAARALAASGIVDPASAVLVADAAQRVLDAVDLRDERRLRAESDLSAILRATLDDPDEVARWARDPRGGEVLGELAATWYRAQLARRFHNDAVAQTQRMRRKWYARLLRLAGRAPMPQTTELDDTSPEALHGLATSAPTPADGAVGVG